MIKIGNKSLIQNIMQKKKIEEERVRKEQEEIIRIRKEKLGKILLIVGFIMLIIGFGFDSLEPGLIMIGFIGFIGCIVGVVILLNKDKNIPKCNSKSNKKK